MQPHFLVLAGLALAASASARTELPHPDRTPLTDYVRGRAADDLGDLNVAATSFASALADTPGDTTLALRTLRQAQAAGDMALAVRTAQSLDQAKLLPPDGTVLLLADAVQAKDWKRASALADRIDTEKLFAFLTPSVRAWIAFAQGRGDADALLEAAQNSPLAASYATEHRVLLLLAQGKAEIGVAALNALSLPDSARGARLRIAAAATLQQRRKRDLAASVLVGSGPAITRARAQLAAGDRLAGAIDSAPAGIAELFVRVAADINRQQAGALALGFARMATALAPQDSETWLVTASLLSSSGDSAPALEALGHVAPNDPFIGSVRDARLTLLARTGRTDEALAEAKAVTEAEGATSGDWARYADLLSAKSRNAEAAIAYGKAAELAGAAKSGADILWPLLLQQGNAQLESGDWTTAKATVERALAFAPEQPAILNFLGYSELEHGGDPATATALIAKASTLAPDDPAITDSLGWSWYVRGDLGRAIPLLEQASRASPAETDINEHLGDAYWKAGRKLEARFAWRAALVNAEAGDMPRIRAKVDHGVTGKP